MEKIKLAPLAITDVDEDNVCVSGITSTGKWIRPEDLFPSDIDIHTDANFLYQHYTELFVLPSTSDEIRVEDRDIVRAKPVRVIRKLHSEEWKEFLASHVDLSVESVFGSKRSVGLIKPREIQKVHYGRTLGGTRKARVKFTDQTGRDYNFILVDKFFKAFIVKLLNEELTLSEHVEQNIIASLPKNMTFFTIGLTRKISNGFPGPYNRCHPLVTGVHTIPNYEILFSQKMSGTLL